MTRFEPLSKVLEKFQIENVQEPFAGLSFGAPTRFAVVGVGEGLGRRGGTCSDVVSGGWGWMLLGASGVVADFGVG